MNNILREAPIYQEILREGREEGREQGQLEALRQAIVSIVLERFPKMGRLAKKQVAVVEDVALLQHLIVKVSTVQSAEEVKQHLLAVDDDEDEV